MSDDCSVKPTLFPAAHLTDRRAARNLDLPRLRLRIENRPPDNASGATSSTTTARESTVSSSAPPNPSSRTSSAEPMESPISSSEPPFPGTFAASAPPWSPTRVPARLRRKCPLFLQSKKNKKKREENSENGDPPAATKKLYATKSEPVAKEEEEEASPVWAPPAGDPSVALDPKPNVSRGAQRNRVPLPVPVPHLIKKSRGRRVPDSDGAQERTHICIVPGCSKSFARAEHLKRHVLSLHTHEKPFACGCGKTFARRDNLLQHQRVHAT